MKYCNNSHTLMPEMTLEEIVGEESAKVIKNIFKESEHTESLVINDKYIGIKEIAIKCGLDADKHIEDTVLTFYKDGELHEMQIEEELLLLKANYAFYARHYYLSKDLIEKFKISDSKDKYDDFIKQLSNAESMIEKAGGIVSKLNKPFYYKEAIRRLYIQLHVDFNMHNIDESLIKPIVKELFPDIRLDFNNSIKEEIRVTLEEQLHSMHDDILTEYSAKDLGIYYRN